MILKDKDKYILMEICMIFKDLQDQADSAMKHFNSKKIQIKLANQIKQKKNKLRHL